MGQLWDDIPEDDRPPWYAVYLDSDKDASMLEVVGKNRWRHVHSELAGATEEKAVSQSGGDSVGDITGERINTGIISALCPDGWKSYQVADCFSDDEDAIDLTMLKFHKGAQGEDDKYFTPGVEISYYSKDSYFLEPTPTNYLIDNFEDWGPMELAGRSWKDL